MRLLGLIMVGLALAMVVAMWLEQARSAGDASEPPFRSSSILITGPGNTLASVARRVGDPRQFSYDPATGTAVSCAGLTIEGELVLGRQGDPGSAEVLELATALCGDLRIEVRPLGALRLYHSTIRTVSQILSNNACSRGYAVFVDGTFVMDHSRISYLSGSTSQFLRKGAKADIRHSNFSYCDGCALNCVNVDGPEVTIEASEILGSGNWGLVVQGHGDGPLEVRDCVLDGQIGAVFLTGESADVRLVDCVFDPSKIAFNGPSGRVAVAWTRRVKVIGATTGMPMADVRVRARPVSGTGGIETVERCTGRDGIAELPLIEWVAQPGQAARVEGRNTAGPYHVLALRPGDRVVAEVPELVVRGKDRDPLVVKVP